MQNFVVELKSKSSESFKAIKAANSLDIDVSKKLTHKMEITADVKSPFSVGLIFGASGSGKTTLANEMFGGIDEISMDKTSSLIDVLGEDLTYSQTRSILTGVGLNSVPCWLKPINCLSNGQQSRAEIAYLIANSDKKTIVYDEFTSVVDRNSAKAMSKSISKFAKKSDRQIVLISCHYDILEWLDPDWVVDCNKQIFIDRRKLTPNERKKKSTITFQIKPATRSSWRMFSKYHYLSSNLPGGEIHTFGLFAGERQIGFQCFANYTPTKKGTRPRYFHSNRTVIHPDYTGFALGMVFVNQTSEMMWKQHKIPIRAKFSSVPMYKSRRGDPRWSIVDISISKKGKTTDFSAQKSNRHSVKTYTFSYNPL